MAKQNNYTVGSLFAGIGGICLGFKQASFKLKWANENDNYACRTYRSNFKHSVYEESVETLDPNEMGSVDIITSGFPCQAFSIAGYQKGFGDPRGNYFFETMRFINALKPKAFLLENVRNLESHNQGNTIEVIKKSIKASGYSYHAAVLDTKDYGGIPQTRQRIYIVGFRIDQNNTTGEKDSVSFQFPTQIPLKKTIHDFLDDEVDYSKFYYDDSFMNGNNSNSNNRIDYFRILQSEITNKDTIYQWRRVYVRENKNRLCPTLTANMGTGGHNVPLIKDTIGIRKLTPRECARFQGFPDSFILPGFDDMQDITIKNPIGQLYKQIGNSVSVPVVARIARSIKTVLDGQ